MHTIKPLDEDAVFEAVKECGVVFSLEEESIIGGLGGAIAELLAEHTDIPYRFRRIGIPDTYLDRAGSYPWLLNQFGLDVPGVVKTIKKILRKK
jgi:transketolase